MYFRDDGGGMIVIKITRLKGKEYYVNADLIQFIEETPDTVLTLTSGQKVVVAESAEEVVAELIRYKKEVFLGLPKVLQEKYT
jgi:flagellar protein FlbD